MTTTEIYAKADVEVKRNALEAAYVKAEFPEQPEWIDDKVSWNGLKISASDYLLCNVMGWRD